MANLGWNPETTLSEGIKKTVKWFIENRKYIRRK